MNKFNIAVGRSRHDKKWQNKQVTWEAFLDRIRDTHRTVEKLDEYVTFKKDRQDEIKDVGGFVGGHLSGGRRLATAVTSRSLLTFDADEATVDFWEKFCIQYECAAALYSTHKHRAEAPRYRLIIPLSREVLADEYVAIMRRIAGDLGIDMFDHTGYQPHRLMYWPSTSKDGEYVFLVQDGPWLDADAVLATYRDWQDVSEWPRGLRENKELNRESKRQGEPTEKPGLIGAFCRAYGIAEVIEKFLPDVYEKCDIEDRYTFLEGSTAAGVVVYDDKFTFSHHSTDPTSNHLCNAFDLVRLHKYGLMDSDSEEVPVNKRPSYLAMCDLVARDELVKQQIGEAKIAEAKAAFSDLAGLTGVRGSGAADNGFGSGADGEEDQELPESDFEWLKEMDVDRKGNYLSTINNVALILENDPVFKDNIAFDEFKQVGLFKRSLPWRRLKGRAGINDSDLANVENYIEKVYKLNCSAKLAKGLLVVLEKFTFHPITTYLKGLVWDGEPRVDRLLVRYLGASDSEYTHAVTRKALAACVARVMKPGTKFDNVLTLVGEEGQGKSALWDRLGGQWFSDTFNMHMLQSKEAYEQIQGVWIIEIGELAGMAKAEVERVKGFISARMDNYRSPWGKTTEQRLRQCVFFASTNSSDFLKSQTGNRRFWPVATHETPPEASVYEISQEEINQIWAEAVQIWKEGENLFLEAEVMEQAKVVQDHYTEENPLSGQIEAYLATRIPKDWYNLTKWEKIDFLSDPKNQERPDLIERDKVCKYEIWEVALQAREPINPVSWRLIDAAMVRVKEWVKLKEYVRFGTSYPRHKGSYRRKYTLENLIG